MNAQNDNPTPSSTTTRWGTPPRSGMQRLIPPWEYRNLRSWAGARLAGGNLLALCGFLTLNGGSTGWKTYGWAALFLVLAALAFAGGYWELTIARSASPRT
jgi:hypothetical protein